ncbi:MULTISPECIES: hypothetical protein [Enterobacteriaceae]|uniref:hypothetical protein n=1 Tax=Enterobacteriaceae TaxID=543 RepID=UPI0015EACFA0|nr:MULTISPECIES: hypothetical protein [Enterobacteriaceae]MBA7875948.1 hypothetical protein [Citrobacter sp. RHBSTW-00827]MBA7936095.1 hypothetical protein [Citrobacter sp. RHBSTW-00509]MBA7937038.1 hypothetical protein [Citrobacter sp. RHBSTW-00509]MDQ1792648.1 hypothetical protein [Klebsiella pneumoniae subsp. pneumoniae]QLS93170.1 hypothetical protein HV302_03760 [Citrobacter sp. RHBSTW-00859]
MENTFFSPSTLGFYTHDQNMPGDAVEVTTDVGQFLRECVIWGADSFIVERQRASVSYPDFMREYAIENNAPVSYP